MIGIDTERTFCEQIKFLTVLQVLFHNVRGMVTDAFHEKKKKMLDNLSLKLARVILSPMVYS